MIRGWHLRAVVTSSLFALLFFIALSSARGSDSGRPTCSNATVVGGFRFEFKMVQHQLRGYFRVIDNCSFEVSQFDMLPGADVRWWGSASTALDNITAGFVISDRRLNGTYRNDSFVVRLRDNVSLDTIGVVSIWDAPTWSDFGYVILPNVSELSPAPSPGGETEGIKVCDEPTTFENCKVLSPGYRVRWTLDVDRDSIDIGLEAATGTQNYMAFGWAKPDASFDFMMGADVVVAGFTEDALPFADDYYITRYSECMVNKDGSARGVCPDTIYEPSDPIGSVNNTELLFGQRRDGVSFIRYRRKLSAVDNKYDLPVKYKENTTVIWALGLMSPPDTLRPYYLPQNHGGEESVNFGHLVLNVSEQINDCLGPMDAEDKEDQDLIIVDANIPLVVTSAEARHYPNPPNPAKVLYINKKEAPVLRVERGVPVKFSIQAGHDVAFYITSDPLGGNATLRNLSETVYAGGPDSQGVLASPVELKWSPDRNTPDMVYYQSLYQEKMGWRIQVVDGGLSDMYNNSVVLDDQQVNFYWTLSEMSISIAARGEKKSNYLAIGFGSGMIDSYAYVGWVDLNGTAHVSTYWIDGQDASSVHPTSENLTYVRCRSENGIVTMEFTRPLNPSCSHSDKPECKNIIDPTTPLRVIWAMGAKWTDGHLTESNMHSATSQRPVRVLLMRGSAEAEQDLRPVLAVHGFMMFLAWGILLPGGILAARYLKHVKGDGWYKIHVYLQYSGLSIIFLALLFAVAELRGFHTASLHVKFGMTAIVFAFVQPLNAYFRPKPSAAGEELSSARLTWEYFHVIVGRCGIIIGVVALFTGLRHLGDRYGGENVHGLDWALIFWFLIVALSVMYLEFRERRRQRERILGRSDWVLGNSDDDEMDPLSPGGDDEKDSQSLMLMGRMEVQLEPFNR
ncbi:hypothetical protein MLD38_020835 [Melastoma candidum]|uniref:Uncharacterized protein n=1 Tax=Melastoma candidum TaxID=119954 RepID=A0ACB9QDI4_9MYRT|nr:hypothetical protein MLD38_020835 [Melastoma candidum]